MAASALTSDDFRVHVYHEWTCATHGPCVGSDIHGTLSGALLGVRDARSYPGTTLVEARVFRPGALVASRVITLTPTLEA
jgi:hypothetical protein